MIQDDAGSNAKNSSSHGGEHDPNARINSVPAKPEEKTSQSVVKPPEPTQQFGTDTSTEKQESQKHCPKEISVKIAKERSLSSFERWSLGLAWVTLIVLVFTFVVFYCQLKESHTQTGIFRDQATQSTNDAKAARNQLDKQFRIDQKPVVWLSNAQEVDKMFNILQLNPTAPRYLVTQWHYANFGKSTAYLFKQSRKLLVGANSDKKIVPLPFVDWFEVLPPGKEDEVTLVSELPNPIPAQLATDKWATGLLRFQYKDSGGNVYQSSICQTHLQAGLWMLCPGGIKDCSEQPCD